MGVDTTVTAVVRRRMEQTRAEIARLEATLAEDEAWLAAIDGPYACPLCGSVSHHPDDIAQQYCNRCHAFTGRCTAGGCTARPARLAGNVALCYAHAAGIGQL